MEIEKFLSWHRLEFDNKAVYINPDAPDWFVPNHAGDILLKQIQKNHSVSDAVNAYLFSLNGNKNLGLIRTEQFIDFLPDSHKIDYPGRNDFLELTHLKECWFHITDLCNLSCRHCLFSCSGQSQTTLSYETLAGCIEQAYRLGTRIFYLTGGEPFMHKQIDDICKLILTAHDDTDLVILTNGLLLSRHLDHLKQLPSNRLHLQISVDGIQNTHDKYRGKGTFDHLRQNLAFMSDCNIHTTLAMAVTSENVTQMADIVDIASMYNIPEVHYIWLFVSGNATSNMFITPDILFLHLVNAEKKAAGKGIVIDNIRNMESQIFSTAGTKHDLGNAGWESLAVGPDGTIYPTPALIGNNNAKCGHIDQTLEAVWRQSPELSYLRSLSIINDETYMNNPLRFIVGGGDIDHSFYAGGSYVGNDPYIELYNKMTLWLTTRAAVEKIQPYPQVLLKMGDRLLQCDHNSTGVALTHSNCVINLSEDKRKTFAEIHRILKPGGRLIISDVVTDTQPPPEILNDEQLRGECIAGAMLQPYLAGMLESLGYTNIRFLKRFFYRQVKNHKFYSLTYMAYKPKKDDKVPAIYPGPFAAIVTDDGQLMLRGHNTMLDQETAALCDDQIFILDSAGNASNIEAENSCACFQTPIETVEKQTPIVTISNSVNILPINPVPDRFSAGCMVCGSALKYFEMIAKKNAPFAALLKRPMRFVKKAILYVMTATVEVQLILSGRSA